MPHPTTPAAVRHPETGLYVALDPAIDYDPSDPLVAAYRWAFAKVETDRSPVESVSIEDASAEPGKKRSRR
jgi:hypothetical protein